MPFLSLQKYSEHYGQSPPRSQNLRTPQDHGGTIGPSFLTRLPPDLLPRHCSKRGNPQDRRTCERIARRLLLQTKSTNTRILEERPTEPWLRSLRRWLSVKPDDDVVLWPTVINQRIPCSNRVTMGSGLTSLAPSACKIAQLALSGHAGPSARLAADSTR